LLFLSPPSGALVKRLFYRQTLAQMENFFGFLAVVVVLAAFPGGYWLARCCAKGVGGRIVLTLVFGAVLLVVGIIAVIAGCSAAGGKMDFK
jgi:hypothetical protein